MLVRHLVDAYLDVHNAPRYIIVDGVVKQVIGHIINLSVNLYKGNIRTTGKMISCAMLQRTGLLKVKGFPMVLLVAELV